MIATEKVQFQCDAHTYYVVDMKVLHDFLIQ